LESGKALRKTEENAVSETGNHFAFIDLTVPLGRKYPKKISSDSGLRMTHFGRVTLLAGGAGHGLVEKT
jgi:hypothetical protein